MPVRQKSLPREKASGQRRPRRRGRGRRTNVSNSGGGTCSSAAIVDEVGRASTLKELKRLVKRHEDRVDTVCLCAVLTKLVAFSESDPAIWGGYEGGSVSTLPAAAATAASSSAGVRQRGGPAEFLHDGTGWEQWEPGGINDEYGDSQDEEDTVASDIESGDEADPEAQEQMRERRRLAAVRAAMSDRRRRLASLAASTSSDALSEYISADATEACSKKANAANIAARQLAQLLQHVGGMVCRRPMPGLDLPSAAAVLRLLAKLGYADREGMALLLGATEPLLLKAREKAAGSLAARADVVGQPEQRLSNSVVQPVSMQQPNGHRPLSLSKDAEAALPSEALDASAAIDLACTCVAVGVRPSAAWLHSLEALLDGDCALRLLRPLDLCAAAHALGSLGHLPPSRWLDSFCSYSAQALLQSTEEPEASTSAAAKPSRLTASPTDVAAYVQGLARMQRLPGEAWARQLCSATLPNLQRYSGAELTDMLTALSALGFRPEDAWMESYYLAVIGQLRNQPMQDVQGSASGDGSLVSVDEELLGIGRVTEMVVALSRLGCRPNSAWLNECLMRSRRGLAASGAEQLSKLIHALSLLRFRAPDAWLQPFLSAALSRLPFASPQQCCSMVGALARLGCVPQGLWLQELSGRTRGRLGQFSCDQLAELAAAMAKLGHRPGPQWMAEWERCSGSKLGEGSSGSLASSAWALSEMGHRPQVRPLCLPHPVLQGGS